MTLSHDNDDKNDFHSHHSNDITIGENVRTSDVEKNSIEKEKYEANADVEEVHGRSKEEDDYPDGMCNTFATFGYVNSWGIFQSYYEETLIPNTPPSNIAWIGSIQYSLVFFPALIVGRLFDLGYFRSIFLPSSAILVVATFLAAECKEYWQLLLCQGLLVGFGCGGIFGPTTAIVAHWFKKRRGLAMGFIAIGSSLGGTLLPIAVKNLIPRVGFPWTMRIVGFILLAVLIASNLLLDRRLPARKVSGGLLNLAAFKYAPYSIYCAAGFFTFLGIYTVLTYVSVSAAEIGISDNFSFYSSLFGRYTAGNLCDRLGPMNVMLPFTTCAAVLTYAWPFAQTKSSLIAVTIIYGFSSGVYVSLLSNPLMEMGETYDVGRRIGMFLTITAFGALIGPPISGAINTATGNFKAVGYYAGSAALIGVVLMLITRHLILRRIFGKL
ncbi:MFS general substrate transporter [Gymnopilus junonius]|uniref:MFS general substrate transporter n=1 Tax=Gymnopilus junonius TaxID=109634 RepID=A0A9P5NT20_GYMJU|nr:MFS general substrate transporter [Gymnopilus junonius]